MPEVISGSTAKEESPTSPLVKLTTALSFLISNPTKGAAGFYLDPAETRVYLELQRDQRRSKAPRNSEPNTHGIDLFETETVV